MLENIRNKSHKLFDAETQFKNQNNLVKVAMATEFNI